MCCCLDSATKTAKFANQSIKLFFTISVVAVTAGGISAGNILSNINFIVKLREREGQRVDLGRSLKGHL